MPSASPTRSPRPSPRVGRSRRPIATICWRSVSRPMSPRNWRICRSPPPMLNGVSGKRELHNDQRSYFDVGGDRALSGDARRSPRRCSRRESSALIHDAFDAPIDDTLLRLEYAQDIDGFWLKPHTDLGVKKFTCLIYLSRDRPRGARHRHLREPRAPFRRLAVQAQRGDDLRARRQHLARLREAAHRRRSQAR